MYIDETGNHVHVGLHFAVKNPPSDIVVTPQYPGSRSGSVTWCFQGESADLSHFSVVIQADGETETYKKDIPSGTCKRKGDDILITIF